MRLSLNEIETTVTKAGLGRGLDFGIAAEVGAATGWLCVRGCDGISEAVAVLSASDSPEAIVALLGLSAVDRAVAERSRVGVAECSSPLMLRALAAKVGCGIAVSASEEESSPRWMVDPAVPAENRCLGEPVLVAPPGWDQLTEWAALTYVPSSDQSRISGAGAGLTDND
jgi:hypothetical protein